MHEGPEIRRAGDMVINDLVANEIIESNFHYERIREMEKIVKNKKNKKKNKHLLP